MAEKKQIKGKTEKFEIKGWGENFINQNQVRQGLYQGMDKESSNKSDKVRLKTSEDRQFQAIKHQEHNR